MRRVSRKCRFGPVSDSLLHPPLRAPPHATYGRSSQPAVGRRRMLVRAAGARPLPRQPDEEPDEDRRDDVPRRRAQLAQQPTSRPTRDAPPFASRAASFGAGAQVAREPEAARDVRLGDGAGDAPRDVRGERARDARELLRESVLVLVLLLVLVLVVRVLEALGERAEAPRRAPPERRDGVADVRGVPRSRVRFRRGARTPALEPRAGAAGVRRGVPVVVASRLPWTSRDARRRRRGWFVPFGAGARGGCDVDPGSVGRGGGARRRGRGHVGVGHVVARAAGFQSLVVL